MLTRHQLDRFDHDGFLVLDRLLSSARVGSLLDEVMALSDEEGATRVKRGAVFARRNLLELDWVGRFANHRALRRLLAQVTPRLRAVRAILFDKTGAANWTVPWHQDRSIAVAQRVDAPGFGPWSLKAGVVHVQPPLAVLRQMLTLRVHLDDCCATNGPLRVVPATHQTLLSGEAVQSRAAAGEVVECVSGAGGALLMRPLILHASSPASTPTHRRVLHIEYGPAELSGALRWAF